MAEPRLRIALEDWRCPSCRRLLAKVNRRGLRPSIVAVEIKCACGRRVYLEGDADDLICS